MGNEVRHWDMGWCEDTCKIKEHFTFLKAELGTCLMMLHSHVCNRLNVLCKMLEVVTDSL